MLKAVIVMAVLLLSVVVIAHSTEAAPYYSKSDIKKMGGKPDGRIIGVIKSDSNCPPEFYARATPKNNNHDLLNKEDISNSDGKTTHKFSWYYDVNLIKETKATNENKIRTYVVGVDIQDVQTGEVVTHYKSISGTKPVDFGVFDMRGASACS